MQDDGSNKKDKTAELIEKVRDAALVIYRSSNEEERQAKVQNSGFSGSFASDPLVIVSNNESSNFIKEHLERMRLEANEMISTRLPFANIPEGGLKAVDLYLVPEQPNGAGKSNLTINILKARRHILLGGDFIYSITKQKNEPVKKKKQAKDRFKSPYGKESVQKDKKPMSGLLAKLVKK